MTGSAWNIFVHLAVSVLIKITLYCLYIIMYHGSGT